MMSSSHASGHFEWGPPPKDETFGHQRELKILAVGGCHVAGYPFDPSKSFINLVFPASRGNQVCSIARLPLTRGAKVREALEQDSYDVLVLQVGNFESVFSLKAILGFWKRKLGMRSPRQSSSLSSPSGSGSEESWQPTIEEIKGSRKFAMMEKLRGVLFVLWMLSGGSLRMRRRLNGRLNAFWAEIEDVLPATTIVVLPLPTVMRTTNRLRIILGRLLMKRLAAREFGGRCIVGFPLEAYRLQGRFRDLHHLTDAGHLSRQGHRLLARQLYKAMRDPEDYAFGW